MSDFPDAWQLATLSELCSEIVDGSHNPPKATEKGFPMLSARNIQDRQINFDEFRFISERDFAIEDARTRAEAGDVLLTIVGTIGRIAIVPANAQRFTLQRSVAVLKPVVVDSRYFAYAMESPGLQKFLADNAKGTAQKGIYLKALSQVEIPIAPLNEQKRIADKLDTVIARVDGCHERLDRIPSILKRFRQSVLAAATSGELTDAQPHIASPTPWPRTNLGSLLTDIRYGTSKKCRYEPVRTPVLRIPNVLDGRVNLEDIKYAVFSERELRSLALVPGDILMIRSNGSLGLVGRTALVSESQEGFLYAGYLIRLRLNHELADPAFISFALSSPRIRAAIEHVARSTSGVNNINSDEIRALEIYLPTTEEQREIVRCVETLFAHADRLEARYKTALTDVQRLTPAFLSKAFRGELVPQDPNDEPASALLERIRTMRATTANKPKRRAVVGLTSKPRTVEDFMLTRKDISDTHLTNILKERGPLPAEALWSASQLDIDDFYDQLKDEETHGLLKEQSGDSSNAPRLLAAA